MSIPHADIFDSPYDLTIVGAGIIGAMAAYQIKKLKPEFRVLLIDKSLTGFGATQYSLGMNYHFASNDLRRKLTLESHSLWKDLEKDLRDLPIQHLAFKAIISKKSEEKLLQQILDPTIHVLNQEKRLEFQQRYSWINISEHENILQGNKVSYAPAQNLTQKIVQSLKDNVCVVEGIAIQDLISSNHHNELITSTNQKIISKNVLLALGPWILMSPWHKIAEKLELRLKKIVSLHFAQKPEALDPMIFFPEKMAFLLPDLKMNQWDFSFTAETWDCPPDINQLYITETDQNLAFSILNQYSPDLIKHYRGGRVFCDAYGPNLSPVVANAQGFNNVIVAGGGSGTGFRLAPAIAAWALSLLK